MLFALVQTTRHNSVLQIATKWSRLTRDGVWAFAAATWLDVTDNVTSPWWNTWVIFQVNTGGASICRALYGLKTSFACRPALF